MFDIDTLLPDVDWTSMSHCRGKADDVPALLRAAVCVRPSPERDRARAGLMDALCYQGSIFEPTLHAAPVFIAALDSDEADLQSWALRWMDVLANAYTMTEGQGTLKWVAEDAPERPEVEAQYEREKEWVAGIHRRVWDAVPRLLALIRRGESEEIVVRAPRTLLEILRRALDRGEEPEALANAAGELGAIELQRLEREEDDRLRACHAGALAWLLGDHGLDVEAALTAEVWPLTYPLTASVAARDLAFLKRGDPQLLGRTLGQVLARADEHTAWLPRDRPIPWVRGHLRFSLVQALCSLPDEAFYAQLDIVADVLRLHTNAFAYGSIAAPVVARVLGEYKVDSTTRRSDLPPRSLPVLEAILASELWERPNVGNTMLAMRPHGLECSREFWARMLSE